MSIPKLKQNFELTLRDFARYPVWRCVQGVDQEEVWYDRKDCDEQTYRPWEWPVLVRSWREWRIMIT